MDKEMCLYCGRRYPIENLTPMYEQGKDTVKRFCEMCLPQVKYNISSLPYSHLFTFGNRGE